MEKKCSFCGQNKAISEFSRKGTDGKGKTRLRSYCRICNSLKCKKYYNDNKEHHLKVIKKNRKKYRQNRKQFIQKVKQLNGCALCGEKELCCLDFHHLHSKDFLLSSNKIISIEKIKQELKKCVCLCANYHRKVHNDLLIVTTKHICKLPEN